MAHGHNPAVVRRARAEDAGAIAELLDAFNREYNEPTPGPAALKQRLSELLRQDDQVTAALLASCDEQPAGLALLRLRPSLWSPRRECHLAELYVVPARRGQGLGRALMRAALALAKQLDADHIDLNTGEHDTAARALYESLGFTNREGADGVGGQALYYEREL